MKHRKEHYDQGYMAICNFLETGCKANGPKSSYCEILDENPCDYDFDRLHKQNEKNKARALKFKKKWKPFEIVLSIALALMIALAVIGICQVFFKIYKDFKGIR